MLDGGHWVIEQSCKVRRWKVNGSRLFIVHLSSNVSIRKHFVSCNLRLGPRNVSGTVLYIYASHGNDMIVFKVFDPMKTLIHG